VRIIAGSLKGRRLKTPSWEGLRPTSDKLRETLFNVLGERVHGARVLDAYAGTGAIGIEAMSRGAAHVTFVDDDRRAIRLIEGNLAHCGVVGGYAIIRASIPRDLERLSGTPRFAPFDIILLDPPYQKPASDALASIGRLVAAHGVVVLEHPRARPAPAAAGRLHQRRELVSGDSALTFYEGVPESQETGDVTPRLAVYPGSFDPLTNGHVDIITRGARLFDRIIVAVLVNADKAPLFSVAERVEIATRVFENVPNVEVDTFDGLLVDYVSRRNAQVIVRGLRAVSDFEFEFQMALMNRRLNNAIETVFMMPAEQYTYTSSRLIKEIFSLGGRIEGLVPAMVEDRLREKRSGRRSRPSGASHRS
jgi:pantetheine-phosphate adenylyltransferase